MTTEQLAIVVPALVAVLIVWLSARFQARINQQTLDHQRRLAVQDRVSTTYVDMLHMSQRTIRPRIATRESLPRVSRATA